MTKYSTTTKLQMAKEKIQEAMKRTNTLIEEYAELQNRLNAMTTSIDYTEFDPKSMPEIIRKMVAIREEIVARTNRVMASLMLRAKMTKYISSTRFAFNLSDALGQGIWVSEVISSGRHHLLLRGGITPDRFMPLMDLFEGNILLPYEWLDASDRKQVTMIDEYLQKRRKKLASIVKKGDVLSPSQQKVLDSIPL